MTKDAMHEREPLNIIMRYKAERTTIEEAAAEIDAYAAAERTKRLQAEHERDVLIEQLAQSCDEDRADPEFGGCPLEKRAHEPNKAVQAGAKDCQVGSQLQKALDIVRYRCEGNEASECAFEALRAAVEPEANAVMNVLAEWDAEPDNGSLVDLGLRILEARRKVRGAVNRGAPHE